MSGTEDRGDGRSRVHSGAKALGWVDEPSTERERIAAKLHQELGQYLVMAMLALEHVADSADDETRQGLQRIRGLLGRMDRAWRDAVFGPDRRPGPIRMPQALAEMCRNVRRELGLGCVLELAEAGLFEPTQQGAAVLLDGVRELLLNIRKHAHCDDIRVRYATRSGWAEVCVIDRAVEGASEGRPRGQGFGLRNLKRELRRVSGHISVVDTLPGRRVRICVPAIIAVKHAGGEHD